MAQTIGLVLAAGGGSRFGGPKALARTSSGDPWTERVVAALHKGGCDRVIVVLGASAEEARGLVPSDAAVVIAADWRRGMAASIGAGMAALVDPDADAAVLTLVDLPDLPATVVRRVLDAVEDRSGLARAVYAGAPGHPVALGRDHWSAFRDSLHGDEGGRRYLEEHDVVHVECGDLFDGEDVDLAPRHRVEGSGDAAGLR